MELATSRHSKPRKKVAIVSTAGDYPWRRCFDYVYKKVISCGHEYVVSEATENAAEAKILIALDNGLEDMFRANEKIRDFKQRMSTAAHIIILYIDEECRSLDRYGEFPSKKFNDRTELENEVTAILLLAR